MAALSPESMTCVICWDPLRDPVTLPCGHSYCMDCIQSHWDQQMKHRCPQCRQSFSPRPVLSKNFMMAALVEDLKRVEITAPPADHSYAAPGDVSCDVCTGRKLKAVCSCLQCLASYCDSHFQAHHEAAVFQRHQLVAPSHHLQENFCSQHNKLMEIFCRKDQQLLCSLCVDQHKGHDMVSSAAERAQRQAQLPARRTLLLQNLQSKKSDLERLQQEAQDITLSAQRAVQLSGYSLRETVLLLKEKHSELEQQIRSEQETQLRQVQELQDQLQQDITGLRKCIFELDTLPLTLDNNQFILRCSLLSTDTQEESRVQTGARMDFEVLTRAVSALRDKLQLSLSQFRLPGPQEVQTTVSLGLSPEPVPRFREDFLSLARDITLDQDTANPYLSLSEGNRRVILMTEPFHDNPERFKYVAQVLSKEELTGRCYWEVERRGDRGIVLAVSYRDINRKTWGESGFGYNNQSWALFCDNDNCKFIFDRVESEVSGLAGSRIGVYLDHSAGALSFYSVQDQTMRLLHRIQTTFTKPLYAGVGLGKSVSASFLKLN